MHTGTRRFILRLAVGLLAFLIGVTVAWAVGGINPFQSFSGTRSYRQYKRPCHYRGSVAPQPAFEYNVEEREHGVTLLKELRGYKMRKGVSELPPPPPAPAAPELR